MNTREELLVYAALQNIFNASMAEITECPAGYEYVASYDGFPVFRVSWDSSFYEVQYLVLELSSLYSVQALKTQIGDGIQKVLEDLYYNYTCKVIDKFKEVCNHKYAHSLSPNSNQLHPIYLRSQYFKADLEQITPNLDKNPDKMTISLRISPAWVIWSRELIPTEIGSYDNLLDLLDRLEEADQTLDDETKYLESLGFTSNPHQVLLEYSSQDINIQVYPCGEMSDYEEYYLFINQTKYSFGSLDELIDFIVRGGD